MLKENNSIVRKFQMIADLGIAVVSFFLALKLREKGYPLLEPLPVSSAYLFLLYIILPVWAVLFYYTKAHATIRTSTLFQVVEPAVKMVLIGGFILIAFIFVFKLNFVSRGLILEFIGINGLLMSAERVSASLFLRHIRKKGRNYRTLLVIGTGSRAREFVSNIMQHREWGLFITGFIDIDPSLTGTEILGRKVLGVIEDLPEILMRNQVDEIVFVGPRSWHDLLDKVAVSCETLGIKMRIACNYYATKLSKFQLDTIADWPLLTLSPPPHYGEMLTVKRAMDVVFSVAFLVLASPVLLLAALGIKLSSPGPVFFRQKRTGQNGRVFRIYKFRTMVMGADAVKDRMKHLNEMSGPVFKVKKDPRVFPFGKFLRKFSIDEAPQFLNVLNGDMSIVGPRPLPVKETNNTMFSERRRLSVKPGLTCLWQINGRNKLGFSDWVKLDLEYIDKWSLGLDLKIMLKTVPAVLKGTGV